MEGETFTIPANRQMGLVARVEDALSGETGKQAITILMQKEGPPYSRLAAAFGAALRYAGATVTDEEIYLSIMEDFTKSRADVALKLQTVIVALLMIIAPPLGKAVSAPAGGRNSKKGLTQNFIRSAYGVAVGQGWVSPSEYWALAPGEFWWLVDAHKPEIDVPDYDDLLTMLNEAIENG